MSGFGWNWTVPIKEVVKVKHIVPVSEVIPAISKPHWETSIKKIVQEYGGVIKDKAKKYGLPPALIVAVILKESGGNAKIGRREPSGVQCVGSACIPLSTDRGISYGLMQIMNWHYTGNPQDLFNVTTNIEYGAKILAQGYKKYNEYSLAVMAYNTGIGNVEKVVSKLGTKEWVQIYRRSDEVAKIRPLTAKYTLPYLRDVFGSGGMLEIAKKYI